MTRARDDQINASDLTETAFSIEEAQKALRMAMEGKGPEARDQFVFHIGFALGKLHRISNRIYRRDDAP